MRQLRRVKSARRRAPVAICLSESGCLLRETCLVAKAVLHADGRRQSPSVVVQNWREIAYMYVLLQPARTVAQAANIELL